MPYNDNQLFYAALYWTEALPGGKAFTDEICKTHGKPYMQMNVPQQTADSIDWNNGPWDKMDAINAQVEAGVNRTQAAVFFEALYLSIKDAEKRQKQENYAARGEDGKYFELMRECSTSEYYFPFSDAIEYALGAAGLPREFLNHNAVLFVHDNGYTFFRPEGGKDYHDTEVMDYPGRPEDGYLALPHFSAKEGSQGLPLVSIEHFYRLVEMEAGKTYTTSYVAVSGQQVSRDYEAREGDFYYVSHQDIDIEDLWTISDEEILSGTSPRVKGGHYASSRSRDSFTAGYTDKECTVEATDDPRIVRQVQVPMRCMDVTEKMQIEWGSSLARLEPGDKIILSDCGRVIPLKKKHIEKGMVRLIDVSIGHDAILKRQQRLKGKAPKNIKP